MAANGRSWFQTNRGWLLFMAGFTVICNVIGILKCAPGIVDTLRYWPTASEEDRKVLLMGLSMIFTILAFCMATFLINMLPIIAEWKKKPKPRLHTIYRNCQIIVLLLQTLFLVRAAGYNGENRTPSSVTLLLDMTVTFSTLLLVHRRMKELKPRVKFE